LGIRAELHYLRGVPHNKVPVWLNAGDVLLVTSSQEGSPNIVKEALACNLPVVSVDVGDVPERLHGIEGCYLASPEPSDLAAKLSLIRARANRIAGRISITELSLERISQRLLNFYEEILGRWSLQIRRPTRIYNHSRY
jgi:glycosyltransferase involved in cell wall biosynthesis